MNANVTFQIVCRPKQFATMFAIEWPLVGMNEYMFIEHIFFHKLFATYMTHMFAFVEMIVSQMTFYISFDDKFQITEFAFQLPGNRKKIY